MQHCVFSLKKLCLLCSEKKGCDVRLRMAITQRVVQPVPKITTPAVLLENNPTPRWYQLVVHRNQWHWRTRCLNVEISNVRSCKHADAAFTCSSMIHVVRICRSIYMSQRKHFSTKIYQDSRIEGPYKTILKANIRPLQSHQPL